MMIVPSLSMPLAVAAPTQPKLAQVGGKAAAASAPEFTQALVQAKPPPQAAAEAAAPAAPSPRQVPPTTLPPERESPPVRRGPPQRLPAADARHAKAEPDDAVGSASARLHSARAWAAESGKARALPAIKPDPRPMPAEGEPPLVLDAADDPGSAQTGSLVQLRPFAPPDCFGGPLTPLPVYLPPGVVAAPPSATTADTTEPADPALANGAAAVDSTALHSTQAAQSAQSTQTAQVSQAARTVLTPATAPGALAAGAEPAVADAAAAAAAPNTTLAAIAAELAGAARQTRTEAAVANLYQGAASKDAAAAVALSHAPAIPAIPAITALPALPAVSDPAASAPVEPRSTSLRQARADAAPAAAPDRANAAALPDVAAPAPREEPTRAQATTAGPTEAVPPNRPPAAPITTAAAGASPALLPSAAGTAGREADARVAPAVSDINPALPLPGSIGGSAVSAYQAAAAAAPAQARLSANPGSPDFAPQLGTQITTFVRNGIEHAQLHLNPAEMGPVSVRIQLEGQTAQVHLSADHALTRQALEASMPQLASQLSEAGLTLGGGSVFEQPRQGREATAQGGSGEPGRSERGNSFSGDVERSRGQTLAAPVQPPMRRGVVDLVA